MPKPKPHEMTEEQFRRQELLKRLRGKRNFLKAVRTTGAGPEAIQKFNQEQKADEREFMTSMLNEMKGMKRTNAKSYVKGVTKNMSTDQLQEFRSQASDSIRHMIPTRGAKASEVDPQRVYHPPAESSGPQRGFSRLTMTVPKLDQPQSFAAASSATPIDPMLGLPVPRKTIHP